MKTYRTIHLLATGQHRALAILITLLLTTLGSCARGPHSSNVTAALENVPAETRIAQTTKAAETAVLETSPAQTEVTSPGYELERPRLVGQLPDSSIAFVSLEGQQAPIIAEAPKGLFAAGFGRHAMQDGPIIYARSGLVQPAYYAIDTLAGMVFPLEFIQQDTHSLAVRPLTEGANPLKRWPAWHGVLSRAKGRPRPA